MLLFSLPVLSSLCDPMDCSMPSLPVPHHLLKLAPVHVHCIGDVIQSISSSVALSSFCPQSFPASGTFPMSWLFWSGNQNPGVSASVLPMSIQSWFPLRLTSLISLLSKGLSRVVFITTVWRRQLFGALAPLWSDCHNLTWPQGRPQRWLYRP